MKHVKTRRPLCKCARETETKRNWYGWMTYMKEEAGKRVHNQARGRPSPGPLLGKVVAKADPNSRRRQHLCPKHSPGRQHGACKQRTDIIVMPRAIGRKTLFFSTKSRRSCAKNIRHHPASPQTPLVRCRRTSPYFGKPNKASVLWDTG